jgi:hypothetical protein
MTFVFKLVAVIFLFTNLSFAFEMTETQKNIYNASIYAVNIGALYYYADQPKVIGGLYVLGMILGAQGKTEEESKLGYGVLGVGTVYNLFFAHEKNREEVFIANIGLWSMFALLKPILNQKNDTISCQFTQNFSTSTILVAVAF